MLKLSKESLQRLESIAELTSIPSPTGNTGEIIAFLANKFTDMGVDYELTAKGALLVTIKGQDDTNHRFMTAHVDTLGAMVRAIKPNGRLKIDLIGGFTYNAIEGEYCTIHSSLSDSTYSGTILMHQTSVHVYKDARTAERNQDNMEVRLDYQVESMKDVQELGIQVGDFISFDPRVVITEDGFIKSRHLDDKVSVSLLMETIDAIHSGELTLAHTTHFYISTNEEIGYGGNSNIDPKVKEYVAIDMGAMGDDQLTDEYSVSICAKDGSGPYHLELRSHLVNLCQSNEIDYRVDIYPFYSSDASAAMRAGADVRHGLIGAGIDSSHAYERTHSKSVNATLELIQRYLESEMFS
ncbi:M42 family metallopeptidase [Aerococcaceae bacterium WGS1372]